ncbi:MAG: DNA primase [Candidatus Shikimatogenerans sp. JK-2022]|nr:DNA primase [Candidatus Shikimatogenerans bostrichidophilus]
MKIIYNEVIKFIKKLNIVKIINKYLKLKKCGNNYKCLSPFKKENNPSFIVSPEKKIWKDFSSGYGGNLIKFFMYYFNIDYNNAIIYILNKFKYKKNYIVNINNSNIKNNKNIFYIYKINKFINNYFKKILKKNKYILNFLIKRGVKKKTIKKFSLSYSPNISLLNFLNKKKILINDFILKNMGLFTIIKNKNYFLFKNRIIFPIKNIDGNIIAFGGRIINTYINKNKYINSPNNVLFNKSNCLYGLYENKFEILKEKFCYIVEGYIDLLSLYQIKIKNVVSTLGTNISNYQIKLIKKFTKNIILLYDGDKTGINGAFKNLNIFLINNININFFYFKNNMDPNSYILKNKIIDKYYFKKKSLDFLDFKIKIFNKYLIYPYKKWLFIKNIFKNLKNINNKILQEFYLQKLINIFNLNKEFVYKKFYKINNKNKNYNKLNIINKKKKKINYYKNLLIYKKKILKFIKYFYKFKNYIIIYKNKNFKQIININKLILFIFKYLNKYKILFYNKKNILLLKKIKNKIFKFKNNKKKKYIKLSKNNIYNIIKENIFKYKLNFYINKINYLYKKIKNNKKNNKNLLLKFYFLIKKKNKIINKLYYL